MLFSNVKVTLRTVEPGLSEVVDDTGTLAGYEWVGREGELDLSDKAHTFVLDPSKCDVD